MYSASFCSVVLGDQIWFLKKGCNFLYEPGFSNFYFSASVQLHTYVFLVPTVQSDKWPSGQNEGLGPGTRKVHWIFGNSVPDGLSSLGADQQEPAENEAHPELGGELKGLSHAERKSVLQVPAALDTEDLKLFTR